LTEFLEERTKAISALQKADISAKARPEDLSKEDWKCLLQSIES
jgi:hypothetical protein